MKPLQLLDILSVAERLKCNTRHSWTSDGRKESVAEHSWRLALLAYFVKDEFPAVDIQRVILMCLCHDLGEAFTGDIPSFWKNEGHEAKEENAIFAFVGSMPEPYSAELLDLFREMLALETAEARLYKALDKTEAVIQHNEADISTWIPLEFEENLRYGKDEVAFSPYLTALREELRKNSLRKIEDAKA